MHRLLRALEPGGIHAGKGQVLISLPKSLGLPAAALVEVGVDAATLHDALHVEIGLAVAEEVNLLNGHGRGEVILRGKLVLSALCLVLSG